MKGLCVELLFSPWMSVCESITSKMPVSHCSHGDDSLPVLKLQRIQRKCQSITAFYHGDVCDCITAEMPACHCLLPWTCLSACAHPSKEYLLVLGMSRMSMKPWFPGWQETETNNERSHRVRIPTLQPPHPTPPAAPEIPSPNPPPPPWAKCAVRPAVTLRSVGRGCPSPPPLTCRSRNDRLQFPLVSVGRERGGVGAVCVCVCARTCG